VSEPRAVGPGRSPGTSSVRPPFLADLRSAVGFLLLSFPTGIFWFVVLITLILLGAALSIVWIGLPILAQAMALVIRGAQAERERLWGSLGVAIPTPYRALPEGSWSKRARARVKDPAIWGDLAYLLLLLPMGVLEFAVVIAAFVLLVGTITLPAWLFVAFPEGAPLWQEIRIDTLPEALIVAVVALPVSALAGYLLITGLSQAHALLGRALLRPSRRTRLAERVEELTESRSRVLAATLAERRRIERDLHDGAQQRLVSLAMELGMAKEKMVTDPAVARKLVEEAHGEAKRALAEIRDLVRGIHSALLSERGLDAAISALADRCPVPVEVDVELDERPPEPVETTAYFVVAEALANVAKHSGASEAQVAVRRKPDDRLVVEVVDDGKGGGDPAAGTGLAGLADRLAALDGRLYVESPAGGPTHVRAELPLGAPDGTTRGTP
jgi:signal transduction histidine kinase